MDSCSILFGARPIFRGKPVSFMGCKAMRQLWTKFLIEISVETWWFGVSSFIKLFPLHVLSILFTDYKRLCRKLMVKGWWSADFRRTFFTFMFPTFPSLQADGRAMRKYHLQSHWDSAWPQCTPGRWWVTRDSSMDHGKWPDYQGKPILVKYHNSFSQITLPPQWWKTSHAWFWVSIQRIEEGNLLTPNLGFECIEEENGSGWKPDPFVDFNRTHCSKLDAAETARLTKTYENRCLAARVWLTTIAAQNGPTTPKYCPKVFLWIQIAGSLYWQLGR